MNDCIVAVTLQPPATAGRPREFHCIRSPRKLQVT